MTPLTHLDSYRVTRLCARATELLARSERLLELFRGLAGRVKTQRAEGPR